MHKKIICRNLSKNLFANLKDQTYNILEDLGYFKHPLQTGKFNIKISKTNILFILII
jgi:hypothetical protein